MKKEPVIFLLLSILVSCSSPKKSNESNSKNENAKQEIEKQKKILHKWRLIKGLLKPFTFLRFKCNDQKTKRYADPWERSNQKFLLRSFLSKSNR